MTEANRTERPLRTTEFFDVFGTCTACETETKLKKDTGCWHVPAQCPVCGSEEHGWNLRTVFAPRVVK